MTVDRGAEEHALGTEEEGEVEADVSKVVVVVQGDLQYKGVCLAKSTRKKQSHSIMIMGREEA